MAQKRFKNILWCHIGYFQLNADMQVKYQHFVEGHIPCGVPKRILTVQERCTWCCWVMIMAKGVRARLTSSRAWVNDTSVFRKMRSTTIPRSRTFLPTVSAYSLHGAENVTLSLGNNFLRCFNQSLRTQTHFCSLLTTITEQSTGLSAS